MPSTVLLSPNNAPLRTLTLSRLQLDQDEPVCTLETQGEELCFYVLIGQVIILDVGNPAETGNWGFYEGRRKVTDPGVAVLRFPAGRSVSLRVELQGFSADVLVASVIGPSSDASPIAHRGDVWSHQVGEGAHQREVREVPTPPEYTISCGETINPAGGVSSWPPHANAEDLAKFKAGVTTWDETFFIVAPSPGIAVLDGYYGDGTSVQEVVRLENGHAYPMCLGSHMCYAAPDSYLYYAWFYCGDALQKQYRKYADDVGVYRK